MKLEVSLSKLQTALTLDALYYDAAQKNYDKVISTEAKVISAHKAFRKLRAKEISIIEKHGGNSFDAYDDLEPIYIAMESADYELSGAYAPFIRHIAVVHILSLACLESHINARAKDALNGKKLNEFYKLSIIAKWLFFPRIMGIGKFDVEKQPFQSFSNLVKLRNQLVHYKEHAEEWTGTSVPTFLKKLALTKEEANSSLKAVRGMISKLSTMLGQKPPEWLKAKDLIYFDFRIVRNIG